MPPPHNTRVAATLAWLACRATVTPMPVTCLPEVFGFRAVYRYLSLVAVSSTGHAHDAFCLLMFNRAKVC